MKVEITREAFRQLVSIDAIVNKVECEETYRRTIYVEHGVRIEQLDILAAFKTVPTAENFASFTTQYFITDINA